MKFLDQQVFIAGYPKSGTSLLYSLLDGHSEHVVLAEESGFFFRVKPHLRFIKALPISKKRKIGVIFRQLMKSPTGNFKKRRISSDAIGDRDYSGFDYSKYRSFFFDYLSRHQLESSTIFDGLAYSYYMATDGIITYDDPSMWIEKTPHNYLFVDDIEKMYEDAKFIFNFRDPRDNYISYKKAHPDLNVIDFCNNWKRAAKVGLGLLKSNPDSVFFNRYEDLVRSPEVCMNDVSSFLGIDFRDVLLIPSKMSRPWTGNSTLSGKTTTISSGRLERYKSYSDQSTIAVIEFLCGSVMDELGYVRQDVSDARNTRLESQSGSLSALMRKVFSGISVLKTISAERVDILVFAMLRKSND